MQKNSLISLVAMVGSLMLSAETGLCQSTNSGNAGVVPLARPETKANVFFGQSIALSVEEIRSNAIVAIKAQGHAMRMDLLCVINVQIEGKDAGCLASFYDVPAKMCYEVNFNRRGSITRVAATEIRHERPTPREPTPKIPPNGVPAKPFPHR